MVKDLGLAVELVNEHMKERKKAKFSIYDDKRMKLKNRDNAELHKRLKAKEKFDKDVDKEIKKIARDEDLDPELVKFEWILRQLLEYNYDPRDKARSLQTNT
jgi:hypothetical protein